MNQEPQEYAECIRLVLADMRLHDDLAKAFKKHGMEPPVVKVKVDIDALNWGYLLGNTVTLSVDFGPPKTPPKQPEWPPGSILYGIDYWVTPPTDIRVQFQITDMEISRNRDCPGIIGWMIRERYEDAKERLLAKFQAPTADWRPNEVIPEDYHA